MKTLLIDLRGGKLKVSSVAVPGEISRRLPESLFLNAGDHATVGLSS